MAGKKYNSLKKEVPAQAVSITDAVEWLKKNVQSKFDQTVEVTVRLGVDVGKSDQMVRSFVTLPGGSPKQKKLIVFTEDTTKQEAAKAAGATIVGGKELIDSISKDGSIDADMAIATPDMMPKIAKVARILGPKGLMPNPKTGTVTADPVPTIKELLAGKMSFKMDTLGNIHEPVAKLSWETDRIVKNVEAMLEAVVQARPNTVKGQFLKGMYLKSTMSPAITLAR